MAETENLQQTTPTADPATQDHGDQGGSAAPETIEGLDVSQIPESVRPAVIDRLKSMRRDYTTKTEAAAAQLREAESLRQKAALADLMLQNPDIAKNLNGKSSDQDDPEDDAAIENLDPRAKRAVNAMLERRIRKLRDQELPERFDPVIKRFTAFEQKEIKKEWDAVTREFPEAKGQEAKVLAFCQANPSISDYRTAVMASLGPEILEARSRASAKADLTMRQNAQTVRNGTPASQTQPKDKPRHSRLAEALEAHLAKTEQGSRS